MRGDLLMCSAPSDTLNAEREDGPFRRPVRALSALDRMHQWLHTAAGGRADRGASVSGGRIHDRLEELDVYFLKHPFPWIVLTPMPGWRRAPVCLSRWENMQSAAGNCST